MKQALVALLLAPLAALGCTKPTKPPPSEGVPAVLRDPIDVMTPGGERTLLLKADADGYTLVDRAGWSIGRAIVEERSLRVTDRDGATLVTLSRTPAGFVVDSGGSGPHLEGQLTDEGLALKRGGELVGAFTRRTLNLGARTLLVIDNDAYVQVLDEEGAVLEVRGPVGDGAAYLAWKELPFPERIALMLFTAEGL